MAKTKGTSIETAVEKSLPTLYLTDDDIVDGLDVGDKVTLTVKARCVGISERNRTNEEGEKEQYKTQDLEILGIEKDKADPKADMARKIQKRGW